MADDKTETCREDVGEGLHVVVTVNGEKTTAYLPAEEVAKLRMLLAQRTPDDAA